ncbi:MAG: hypothetical protein P1U36_10400 [Legionellaceae bacterium]|nr:hypothetical protein [Legionellaceae bacterium]
MTEQEQLRPVFLVKQEDYDDATDEERETMKVFEEILPLPDFT